MAYSNKEIDAMFDRARRRNNTRNRYSQGVTGQKASNKTSKPAISEDDFEKMYASARQAVGNNTQQMYERYNVQPVTPQHNYEQLLRQQQTPVSYPAEATYTPPTINPQPTVTIDPSIANQGYMGDVSKISGTISQDIAGAGRRIDRLNNGGISVDNSLLRNSGMSDDELRMLENQGYYGGADVASRALAYPAIATMRNVGGIINEAEGTWQNLTGESGQTYSQFLDETVNNPMANAGQNAGRLYQSFKEKQKNEKLNTKGLGYAILDEADRTTQTLMNDMDATEQFFASTMISVLQNLELMPIALIPGGQNATLALMSLSAAGNTMHEKAVAGKSLNDAWVSGIIDGTIEAATESIGVDNWIKMLNGKSGSLIRSLLVQAGSEGGEEFIGYIMNYLVDVARKDPDAKFSLQELLTATMSGALSGLILGGIGAGGNMMNMDAAARADYLRNAYTYENMADSMPANTNVSDGDLEDVGQLLNRGAQLNQQAQQNQQVQVPATTTTVDRQGNDLANDLLGQINGQLANTVVPNTAVSPQENVALRATQPDVQPAVQPVEQPVEQEALPTNVQELPAVQQEGERKPLTSEQPAPQETPNVPQKTPSRAGEIVEIRGQNYEIVEPVREADKKSLKSILAIEDDAERFRQLANLALGASSNRDAVDEYQKMYNDGWRMYTEDGQSYVARQTDAQPVAVQEQTAPTEEAVTEPVAEEVAQPTEEAPAVEETKAEPEVKNEKLKATTKAEKAKTFIADNIKPESRVFGDPEKNIRYVEYTNRKGEIRYAQFNDGQLNSKQQSRKVLPNTAKELGTVENALEIKEGRYESSTKRKEAVEKTESKPKTERTKKGDTHEWWGKEQVYDDNTLEGFIKNHDAFDEGVYAVPGSSTQYIGWTDENGGRFYAEVKNGELVPRHKKRRLYNSTEYVGKASEVFGIQPDTIESEKGQKAAQELAAQEEAERKAEEAERRAERERQLEERAKANGTPLKVEGDISADNATINDPEASKKAKEDAMSNIRRNQNTLKSILTPIMYRDTNITIQTEDGSTINLAKDGKKMSMEVISPDGSVTTKDDVWPSIVADEVIQRGGGTILDANNLTKTETKTVEDNAKKLERSLKKHEKAVRQIEKFAKKIKQKIGYYYESGAPNGIAIKGGIAVNMAKEKGPLSAFAHEVIHKFSKSAGWDDFVNAMGDLIRRSDALTERAEFWTKQYTDPSPTNPYYQEILDSVSTDGKLDRAKVNEEVYCKIIEELIEHEDVDFESILTELTNNKSFLEKMLDVVSDIKASISEFFGSGSGVEYEARKEVNERYDNVEDVLKKLLSGEVTDDYNENKFSLNAPVEYTKNLIGNHSLDGESLVKFLSRGGAPSISVAIVNLNTIGMGIDDFGSYSLILNKDSYDPALNSGLLGSGDIWSPMLGWLFKIDSGKVSNPKATEKRVKSLIKLAQVGTMTAEDAEFQRSQLADLFSPNYNKAADWFIQGDDALRTPDIAEYVLQDNEAMQRAFLANEGEAIEVEYGAYTGETPYEAINRVGIDKYKAFVKDFVDSLGLYDEYVNKATGEVTMSTDSNYLESLTDQMSAYNKKAITAIEERTPGVIEENADAEIAIMYAALREFDNLEDVKERSKSQLAYLPQQEYEAIKSDYLSEYRDIMDRLIPGGYNWQAKDQSVPMGIARHVAEAGNDYNKLRESLLNDDRYIHDRGVIQELIELVDDIKNFAPAKFFEAKMNRATTSSDVAFIVAPEGEKNKAVGKAVSRLAEEQGIPVYYWDDSQKGRNTRARNKTSVINSAVRVIEMKGMLTGDNPVSFSLNGGNNISSYRDADIQQTIRDKTNALRKQYGTMEERPNHRNVKLPLKTADNQKTNQTARTLINSEATSDDMAWALEDAVARGEFSHEVLTDKNSLDKAKDYINRYGYKVALEEWDRKIDNGLQVGKEDTTKAMLLYSAAVDVGDTQAASKLAAQLSAVALNAGQVAQSVNIMKRLTPEGRMYYAQLSIAEIQRQLDNKYGKKSVNIMKEIDPSLIDAYKTAQSKAEVKKATAELFQAIADKLPNNFFDVWNAYRYLAMLGNPRTQIRNVLANAIQIPMRAYSQATRAVMESALSRAGVDVERTTTLKKATKEQMDFAKQDALEMEERLNGDGKYKENSKDIVGQIDKYKNPFQYKAKWADKQGNQYFLLHAIDKAGAAVSKGLTIWNKATNYAMDKGDLVFSQSAYTQAMAKYMAANNLTAADMHDQTLERARAEATRQALEAVFREQNDIADAISKWENTLTKNGKLGGYLMKGMTEGIVPFKRTPMNIAKRSIEYTPIGIATEIGQRLIDQQTKGEVNMNNLLDGLSKGFSGTSLIVLGMLLAKLGILRAGGSGDDKKKKWDKQMGYQDYSINFHNILNDQDYSISMEWAGASMVPLFIGAAVEESFSDDELSLTDITNVLGNAATPIFETTMFDGLNSTLKNVAYANDPISGVLQNAGVSYVSQGVPTILGQVARTVDPISRTTYVAGETGFSKVVKKAVQKAENKTPGLSRKNVPFYDVWGNKQTNGGENAFTRLIYNTMSPGYIQKVSKDPVEIEIANLYKATGDDAVIPTNYKTYASVDNERVNFSKSMYMEFTEDKGEMMHEGVSYLIGNSVYNSMSNETKKNTLYFVYRYGESVAKTNTLGTETEGWINNARGYADSHGISENKAIMMCAMAKGAIKTAGATKKDDKIAAIQSLGYSYAQAKELYELVG